MAAPNYKCPVCGERCGNDTELQAYTVTYSGDGNNRNATLLEEIPPDKISKGKYVLLGSPSDKQANCELNLFLRSAFCGECRVHFPITSGIHEKAKYPPIDYAPYKRDR